MMSDEQRHVLMVEDDDTIFTIVKVAIRPTNISLLRLPTAEGVEEQLANKKFDVILLDIHLPGKSGYELLTELRNNPAAKGIPIIAFSAGANSSHALSAGFDGFIGKPFTAAVIPNLLKKIMQGERVWVERS